MNCSTCWIPNRAGCSQECRRSILLHLHNNAGHDIISKLLIGIPCRKELYCPAMPGFFLPMFHSWGNVYDRGDLRGFTGWGTRPTIHTSFRELVGPVPDRALPGKWNTILFLWFCSAGRVGFICKSMFIVNLIACFVRNRQSAIKNRK